MSRFHALHLGIAGGRRFALLHEPSGEASRLVVHVHAFAEEMNKSRRMVAIQARKLAEGGAVVLVPDLLGCGDSDGELNEVAWEDWVRDVAAACDWAERWMMGCERCAPIVERWLWGHRAGALLATMAAQRSIEGWNLLFWQPVLQGAVALKQFLRLDIAASRVGGGRAAGDKSHARSRLSAGLQVEVAGYELSPALADGFGQAHLCPPTRAQRLEWLEVSGQEEPSTSTATRAAIEAWREAGWAVRHRTVRGPAFWQTTETEDAPALVEATCAAIREMTADDPLSSASAVTAQVGA